MKQNNVQHSVFTHNISLKLFFHLAMILSSKSLFAKYIYLEGEPCALLNNNKFKIKL
jgi:hypothetical protein